LKQTNHFFNLGYGWLCKHCSTEEAEHHEEPGGLWRFLQKRGTEEKKSKLPSLVLARWTDPTRRSLRCPHCGIEEMVKKGE
jgi:hypothetical protein